jgi:hypothetical protein
MTISLEKDLMRTRSSSVLIVAALAVLITSMTSCASLTGGDSDSPDPTATETSPPATATVTDTLPTPSGVGGIAMSVPFGWYSTVVELDRLEALIFVEQDPAELAEFDDPDLALPLEFAAGALIITPLPDGSDAETLSESMLDAIPALTGDDLDAMLLPLDQAGLIDYTAVSGAELLRAVADTLAGMQALMMDGMVAFVDDLPPLLHVQVWLTWTEESFVAYYALAAEQAWPDAEAPLIAALDTVSIR